MAVQPDAPDGWHHGGVRLIVRLLATAAATALAAWLVPGITLTGDHLTDKGLTLAAVALLIGLVNAVVKPVVKVLTGCLVLLTLGLFLLVINAAMLLLVSWLAGPQGLGFTVDGFWPALWGSLVISLVSGVLFSVMHGNRKD
ncbi:phage holin family protein [Aestuariimicrobium ganziense]|uniref:phage holin family protein n=1 Tax=Aestuariimicrobium ganziense TaxID=2773677 RepID=UPI001944F612|nr:phage holin family protein [Aestuariimicrobium ganziense]